MSATILFRGLSGNEYEYWFFDIATDLVTIGGQYGFVKRLPNGHFVPLYWGECQNFTPASRTMNVSPTRSASGRPMLWGTPNQPENWLKAEERDLIAFWNPPMNVQHRSVG